MNNNELSRSTTSHNEDNLTKQKFTTSIAEDNTKEHVVVEQIHHENGDPSTQTHHTCKCNSTKTVSSGIHDMPQRVLRKAKTIMKFGVSAITSIRGSFRAEQDQTETSSPRTSVPSTDLVRVQGIVEQVHSHINGGTRDLSNTANPVTASSITGVGQTSPPAHENAEQVHGHPVTGGVYDLSKQTRGAGAGEPEKANSEKVHDEPHDPSKSLLVSSVPIFRISHIQRQDTNANTVPWLIDTGCEGVTGVTSLKNLLVNIKPAHALFQFGNTNHEALETGDLPLGNGQYIHDIHILPNISKYHNIISPMFTMKRDYNGLELERNKKDEVIKAGTKLYPGEFKTAVRNESLTFILIPTYADREYHISPTEMNLEVETATFATKGKREMYHLSKQTPRDLLSDINYVHRQLAHAPFKLIRGLYTGGNAELIAGLPKKLTGIEEVCRDCVYGKTVKGSNKKKAKKRDKAQTVILQEEYTDETTGKVHKRRAPNQKSPYRLHRVVSDLCGPFPKSTRNKNSFATFTDTYSCATYVSPISSKEPAAVAEAFKKFTQWIATNSIEERNLPATVLTDSGSEYKGEFKELMESLNIALLHTLGYDICANGVAERMNRTIRTRIRVLLMNKPTLGKYWDYAASYSGHQYNVTKIYKNQNGIQTTAYEAMTGHKPKALLDWGSDVYVHIPVKLGNPASRNKHDATAEKVIYLGPSDNMRHSYVLQPTSWTVKEVPHVVPSLEESTLWKTLPTNIRTPHDYFKNTTFHNIELQPIPPEDVSPLTRVQTPALPSYGTPLSIPTRKKKAKDMPPVSEPLPKPKQTKKKQEQVEQTNKNRQLIDDTTATGDKGVAIPPPPATARVLTDETATRSPTMEQLQDQPPYQAQDQLGTDETDLHLGEDMTMPDLDDASLGQGENADPVTKSPGSNAELGSENPTCMVDADTSTADTQVAQDVGIETADTETNRNTQSDEMDTHEDLIEANVASATDIGIETNDNENTTEETNEPAQALLDSITTCNVDLVESQVVTPSTVLHELVTTEVVTRDGEIRRSKRIKVPTEKFNDWMNSNDKTVPNKTLYNSQGNQITNVELLSTFNPEISLFTIAHAKLIASGTTKFDPKKVIQPANEIQLKWYKINKEDDDSTNRTPIIWASLPSNERDVRKASDGDDWRDAQASELLDQLETKALIPVKRTKDIHWKQIIQTTWVFTLKRDINYEPIKRKARMPICGNLQDESSYDETSSPVMMRTSLSIFLVTAAQNQWTIHQIDISHAYLNADIDKEIYIRPNKTFLESFGVTPHEDDFLLRVNKAVYGLKQSGYLWYMCFTQFMVNDLGFVPSERDPCILYKHKVEIDKEDRKKPKSDQHKKAQENEKRERILAHPIVVLLYVDDCLIIHKEEKLVQKYKEKILKRFPGRETEGGIGSYLGMTINQSESKDRIEIHQHNRVDEIVEQWKTDSRFAKIPMTPEEGRALRQGEVDTTPLPPNNEYLTIVGKLSWLCGTRPDIAYTVSILAQQCSKPTLSSWTQAMRLVNYLAETRNYTMIFKQNKEKGNVLEAYADASFKQLPNAGSVSGMLLTYAGNAFCWKVKKQKHITTSTRDAEMSATFSAVIYVNHFRTILKELSLMKPIKNGVANAPASYLPTAVYQDNQALIHTLSGTRVMRETTSGLMEGYAAFIREHVQDNGVKIVFISTHHQRADIFTKPLGITDHSRFMPLLSIQAIPLTQEQKLKIIRQAKDKQTK